MSDAPSGTGFLGAVQFLTRVPIRLRTAPDIARSAPWFPVVGALVGALAGGAGAGLDDIVPNAVGATLAVLLGVAVTGAFHEDGLADTFDAFGGWTPEQRREILKDSRHGSYGVAALTSSILLRLVCVTTLSPAALFGGLVASHTLGRTAALGVMTIAPTVEQPGLGSDYARSTRPLPTSIGAVAGLAIAALAIGWWAVPVVLAVGVGAVLTTLVAMRAFGGVTGDVLGAVEQIGECAALVVLSGLAMNGGIWWA